ncbi:acetyltransferase [Pectobacterium sp. A5351]|uniref:acetyltransferase n=1 Tax=Pectobacterium sp. A5351 TaxID=2914983 RepID=UPI00232E29B0|nr:acetyltransferase [Pectobacterium sp. A5351]WCG81857.1 acetyltransferase [Pectobacterium sp. A5351]
MKLGIYGAGGLGREVLRLAQIINATQNRWDEFIFIDDFNPGGVLKGIQVTDFASVSNLTGLEIVIAIGEPAARHTIAEKIEENQLTLATLVHPSVDIPACTTLGNGVVVCQGASISCDITVKDNAYLQPNICIGHDCVIENHSVISPGVSLAGNCHMGSRVFIGMNVAVKEKTTIGDDVIVSMGAVVFNDIEPGVIVLGNPARVMRKNESGRVFK